MNIFKTLVAGVALALMTMTMGGATMASAGEWGRDAAFHDRNVNNNSNGNWNTNRQAQRQDQDQLQQQAQGQQQAQANRQSVTFGGNAPAMASGNCTFTVSAGGPIYVAGFGIPLKRCYELAAMAGFSGAEDNAVTRAAMMIVAKRMGFEVKF